MFKDLKLFQQILGILFLLMGLVSSAYAQAPGGSTGIYWDSSAEYDPEWGISSSSPHALTWDTGYTSEWDNSYQQENGLLYFPHLTGSRFSGNGENGYFPEHEGTYPPQWSAQILPKGTLYPAYLAGRKESRLQSMFTREFDYGWLWDISLGGRVPLFRFGTETPVQPEGFQIDMEGAALLRLDFERDRNLAATDYRAGLPITYGTKFWQLKTGYYHISSHLGDNYLLDGFQKKVHYVRDEIFLGLAFKPVSAVRIYGEAGWAFNAGETTSPWEFQVGAEFSPVYSEERTWRGAPFAAVHGHLFQELDFSGYVNSQIGWQWRRSDNGLFRIGAEFYCGYDDQYQFHQEYQKKAGLGFWYDF